MMRVLPSLIAVEGMRRGLSPTDAAQEVNYLKFWSSKNAVWSNESSLVISICFILSTCSEVELSLI